jgi:hypothetical protein
MGKSKIKEMAFLKGYDKDGNIVYSEELSLDQYYDGEHIWDKSKNVKKRKLVKIQGKIYNYDGILEQEFENAYSETTGEYIGGIAKFDNGTINKDGIYQDG